MLPLAKAVNNMEGTGLIYIHKPLGLNGFNLTCSIPAGDGGQAAIENTLRLPYVGGTLSSEVGTPARSEDGCYWAVDEPYAVFWFQAFDYSPFSNSATSVEYTAAVRLVTE